MSRYRYISTQLGAPFAKIAELPLTGVSWQRLRNGAGVLQGAVKLPPPITDEARVRCALYREATDQDTTCIYVLRDNVPVGAYAVGTQSYSSENQQISVNGAELSSYFRRRIIEDLSGDLDLRVSFEGQPMYDAVAAMVGRINDIGLTIDATTGGPLLPVTVPATDDTSEVAGTGWKGTDTKLVGEAIDELAAMDDGFDYRTDLLRGDGTYVRAFVLRPTLGEQVNMIAKYGATLAGFNVRRRTRTNDAIAIGGSDGDKRPYGRATDTTFTPPLTAVTQLNDEADTVRLDAASQAALDASRSGEVVEFEVIEDDGKDAQIGALFPGDNCRIVIPKHKDSWYVNGLDTVVQTLGFTVKVPDSGGRETISLQIDEGDIDG